MKFRHLVAIWAALSLLLLAFVWVVPSFKEPEVREFDFGGVGRKLSWVASSSKSTTIQFETDVQLSSSHVSVEPHLFVEGEGLDEEEALVVVRITTYGNGEKIDDGVYGLASTGRVVMWEPVASTVDQSHWKAGSNHLRLEFNLRMDVKQPTDKRINFTVGPVKTFVREADLDNDGIPDTQQPITGVHTGLVWLGGSALAGLLAVGVWYWRRKRDPPP